MNDKLQRELEDLCLQILRDRGEDAGRMLASVRSLYEKLIVINHEKNAAIKTETPEPVSTPVEKPKSTSEKESPEVKVPEFKEEPSVKKVDEEKLKTPKPKKPANEVPEPPKANMLHQRIQPKAVTVGLNDRIAFVKKLFHGQTDDFNRVLSQINTFNTYEEADAFLTNLVIPEYSWDMEEEYAIRFTNLVRMRFGLDEIPEE
jgi:hypothetical protein